MSLIRKTGVTSLFFYALFSLTGIGAASSKDQTDGSDNIPSYLTAGKIREHAPQFFESFDSVQVRMRSKQALTFVDVRNSNEYASSRIPGSINIPLFAVKTKRFLKSTPVVFVNRGFNYTGLEQECRRLKSAGFNDVSILIGGLANWKQKGAPIKGDYFEHQELNKISPDDFFAERNYKHLAIVNVCHQGKDDSAFLTPRAHFIPYKGKAEGFLNRLKEISKNTQEDPLSSVLICNANGDYPKKLEELVQSGGIRNTFYLKGGLEAYRVFLRRQVDILRANGTKKIVKGCRTCP